MKRSLAGLQAPVLAGVVRERTEKAADLAVIISEMKKLPPGQLKRVLSDEVIAVLEKYGISFASIKEEA